MSTGRIRRPLSPTARRIVFAIALALGLHLTFFVGLTRFAPERESHLRIQFVSTRRAATIRQTLAGPTTERAAALKKRETLAARAMERMIARGMTGVDAESLRSVRGKRTSDLPAHLVHDRRGVAHGIRVGHRRDGGEAAECGGAAAGLDGLGLLLARLAQVHVEVD